MRSAVLKFDVHSVFAISSPIYEIQNNSIYSINIQILVNAYVHTPCRFVSHKINLQGVKFSLLMHTYELVTKNIFATKINLSYLNFSTVNQNTKHRISVVRPTPEGMIKYQVNKAFSILIN